MVNDLVADAMMDALDIAIRQEPVDLAAMLAEVVDRQPRARRAQAPDDPPGVAAGALVELRPGPAARGGRQSRQQRHQVQPGRRQDRAVDERRPGVTVIRVKDEGAGLSQEDLGAPVRPLPAPVRQADRRRELDRARPLDRQAHRRAARRHGRRRERRAGPRLDLHDPAAGGVRKPCMSHAPSNHRGRRRGAGARDGRRLSASCTAST